LDKFRDNVGNWREQIQRVKEDILKVAVLCSMQEDETERGKLRAGNCRRDCDVKGIIIIIKIFIGCRRKDIQNT